MIMLRSLNNSMAMQKYIFALIWKKNFRKKKGGFNNQKRRRFD